MKIRGNTVGTPIRPELAVVKCENLTDEQKAQARNNIGAASKDDLRASSGSGIPQHLTGDVKEKTGKTVICDEYKQIKLENLLVCGQSTTDKTPAMNSAATISGVTSPTVTGSKNLIPKFTGGRGDNGGTFTVRNDGSILFTNSNNIPSKLDDKGNETATTKIGVTFFLDAGDYIISGDPVYSSRTNNYVYIQETSGSKFLARSYFYKKNEKEPDDDVFTLTARTEVTAYVCVGKASAEAYETANLPLVFYPMVRRADTDETYAAPATKTFDGITLHGVGGAKDYIDCANGKIVRYVGSVTFTGSDGEGWNKSSTSKGSRFSIKCDNLDTTIQGVSNRFEWGSASAFETGTFWFTQNGDNAYIEVLTDATSNTQTKENFLTWLRAHNLTVYYPLKTPIEEAITDDALLESCQTLLNVTDTYFTSTTQLGVKYVERKVITFSNTAEMIANFKEEDKICYVLNDDSYFCKGYKGNYYVYKYDKTYVDRNVIKTYPEIALAKGGYAGLVIPEFKPLKHNYACIDKVLDIAYSYCGKDIQYVTSNGPISPSAHEGIQCSQFVNTLLLGLYYDKSRLADPTSDNPLCAGGCKWLLEEDYRKADSQIRSPANTFCLGAEGLARFAAARGWLNHTQYLTDCEVGDLLFFAEATPKNLATNWNGIGHVGMVIGKEEIKDDSENHLYTAVQFIQAGGVGDTTSERFYPDGNGGEIEFTLDENGKIIAPQAVCIQTIKDYGKPYILSNANGSTARYCLVGYGRLPMYYEDEGVISTEYETDANVIKYTAQTLTGDQKAQARENIGAADGAELESALASVTEEMADIRVGYDGKTYASAGEAVRSQVGSIEGRFEPSRNLINPDRLVIGKYDNGGFVGDGANYAITEFIPVKPSTPYWFSWACNSSFLANNTKQKLRFVTYYDSNKTYLSKESAEVRAFTTPENAAYVRLTIYKITITDIQVPMLFEGTTNAVQIGSHPYTREVGVPVDGAKIKERTVGIEKLTEEIITTGKNLFDKSSAPFGFLGSAPDEILENASYVTSGYIPVKAGQSYTISPKASAYALYDTNKDQVSRAQPGAQVTVTPEYDGFIRVSFPYTNLNTAQIEEGTEATSYEPFMRMLSPGIHVSGTAALYDYKNMLTEKKWYACGDSFTAGGYGTSDQPKFESGLYEGKNKVYPFYIGRRCGINVTNLAVGGQTMAKVEGRESCFSENIYQNIGADANYITIRLGINDDNQNVPIGTIDDADNTTFYGAWNVVMEYLITNHPFAHIGIIVPNGADIEYVEAVKAIAIKWGVPYLDFATGEQVPLMHRTCRYNVAKVARDLRHSAFIVGDGNTHPNADAHEYESYCIENWLMSL